MCHQHQGDSRFRLSGLTFSRMIRSLRPCQTQPRVDRLLFTQVKRQIDSPLASSLTFIIDNALAESTRVSEVGSTMFIQDQVE